MIKVAIVGCGSITQKRHAPEYRDNPYSKIIGFYDHYAERALTMQMQYGGKVYSKYAKILSDPIVDAVSICTANAYHAEMTIQALHAGKHVLCEKPMALSVKDAMAMRDAEAKSKKLLMVGHNQRFTKAHIMARNLLESGEIGQVLTFKTCFGHSGPEMWSINKGADTWFFDRKIACLGSLGDLGVHKIDLLRFLLQDEIDQVMAMISTLDKKNSKGLPIEVDDNIVSLIKMGSGAMGTLECSWTYYGEENNSTTIYGKNGIMKIYYSEDMPLMIIRSNGSRQSYETEYISTNQNQKNSGVIDAFITSVKDNSKPVVGSLDGLESLKVVEAMIRSAHTGELTKV